MTKMDQDIENTTTAPETEKIENKKKARKIKNPFLRFIVGLLKLILWIILAVLIVLIGWITFSSLDRRNELTVIPNDFSVVVRADSVWDTVEPLLDLQAADILLSEPNLASLRGVFMQLRSMDIRKNFVVNLIGKRSLTAALYLSNNDEEKSLGYGVTGVLEMGWLSAVTRLAPVVVPHIYVPGLSYNAANKSFAYETEGMTIFAKTYHNLVVVSTDAELFGTSISADNKYTFAQKSQLKEKDNQSVKIYVDTKNLVGLYSGEQKAVKLLEDILDFTSYSRISFTITDKDISFNTYIPYITEDRILQKYPVLHASTVPALISRLPENVQYYTMLNVGSLEQLKNSAVPFVPEKMDFEALWNTGNGLSKNLFGSTIDELLFSWTGDELAILGLEGQNDPVFAMQIRDEKTRAEVFNQTLSSILLRSDNSLILDGIRMPQIQLPSYIQNILNVFNVSLSMPYYMVEDGYIYFSSSAECLSNLHTAFIEADKITDNVNYAHVAKNLENNIFMSLYYDLEKTIPFFLRSNAKLSKILELYTLGRCDFSMRNGSLVLHLQATSENAVKLREVPGFPVTLEGGADGKLYVEKTKTPSSIYWIQDRRKICSMEIPSTKKHEMTLNENVYVCSVEEVVKKQKNQSTLWAVTKSGTVYLLDKELNIDEHFPVVTNVVPSAAPVAMGSSVAYLTANGTLCVVNAEGEVSVTELKVKGNVLSSACVIPSVNEIAFYAKGFIGNIYVAGVNENAWKIVNENSLLQVNGIGFGSPAVMEKNGTYIAFVTQAGLLHMWKYDSAQKEYAAVENFPVKLNGVYASNAVACGEYFYLLSVDGILTRVDTKGEQLSVQVPYGKGTNPYVTAGENKGKNCIYVCADSNVIYGFTEELELVYGYPVAGYGVPAFGDVDGDKINECFTLGLDDRLYCWNID